MIMASFQGSRKARLLSGLLLTALCLVPGALSAHKRPNILVLIADDLGYGDVGCFGNDTLRTPNIDRLATEGVKLTHHLAAASVCTPSRAALMTGRYPIRYGMVPHNYIRVNVFVASSSGIPDSEITFAEMAKEQGYNTALIGKWHLGLSCMSYGDNCHHPLKHGFDYFYGLPLTNVQDLGKPRQYVIHNHNQRTEYIMSAFTLGGVILAIYLWTKGFVGLRTFLLLVFLSVVPTAWFFTIFLHFDVMNGVVMRNYDVVDQPVDLEGFTSRLVREGRDYLQENKDADKPFLLVMSWVQVHTAMHATKPFKGRSQHGTYGDEVEEMDWSVGEILNALDEFGLTDDTFVYFTSDNGGHVEEKGPYGNREGGYNGPFRGGKFQGAMDGGIRVPTLVRMPGVVPPQTTIDVPTSMMDVFPTIANLMGATTAPGEANQLDGRDILPLLKGETRDTGDKVPHDFFVHYCGDTIHGARYIPGDGSDVYKVHYASPNWEPGTEGCGFNCHCSGKSISYNDPPLLYNIARDPSEDHALDTSEPRHQALLREIQTRVDQHRESLSDEPVDQFKMYRLLPIPWLQPCCGGGVFPYCNCRDAKFPPQLEK